MRAVRENRDATRSLFSLSLLSLFSRTRARKRGGEGERTGGRVGARSYSPLLHPWQQHHCDGPWSRSDQCHRRAPLCFRPHCIRPVVMTTASPPTPPEATWCPWWGTWVAAKGVTSSSSSVPFPSRPFLSPSPPPNPSIIAAGRNS